MKADRVVRNAGGMRNITMEWRCALGLVLTYALVAMPLGCSNHGEPSSLFDKTLADLSYLGHVGVLVLDKGATPAELQSLESLISAALKYHVGDTLKDEDDARWTRDRWGRSFKWNTSSSEPQIVVRITSNGRDGLSQNGEGDDLYVEIRKHTNEPAKMKLRPARKSVNTHKRLTQVRS